MTGPQPWFLQNQIGTALPGSPASRIAGAGRLYPPHRTSETLHPRLRSVCLPTRHLAASSYQSVNGVVAHLGSTAFLVFPMNIDQFCKVARSPTSKRLLLSWAEFLDEMQIADHLVIILFAPDILLLEDFGG